MEPPKCARCGKGISGKVAYFIQVYGQPQKKVLVGPECVERIPQGARFENFLSRDSRIDSLRLEIVRVELTDDQVAAGYHYFANGESKTEFYTLSEHLGRAWGPIIARLRAAR